ncbi:MAG: TIGR01212 family radical SAM protein [Bacteroidales bacterium]|nr:TIGR01212 family radical SAM protein [Bacteroidales bacterium]
MNPFDNRRFNSYSAYYKRLFGSRVQKISIAAGFTCPNRDGTLSIGGCTFCSNEAFNPSYCKPEKSIRQQIEEGIEFHQKRYRRASQYLAYFQAYSNTYKPLEELKSIYAQALEVPEIAGIVIGTRPDCIGEPLLHYLNEIQKNHYVMLEYGVESVYDETLKRVNRGHDFATAQKAIELTAQHGIPCGGHFIFGLPGETKAMILEAADIISQLPLTTVKFHQLQIFKGTKMAEEYQQHPEVFHLFDLEEYIEFVIDFVERLNPDLVIERFAGEVPPRYLVSEPWMKLRYDQVLSLIEKRMEERDTWQGRLYSS